MSAYDLPLAALEGYRPEREEPADFDAFWHDTLTSSRAAGGPPLFERIDGPLRTVTVDDVTFSGFAGHPIKGWLIAPVSATLPLPTIIEFIGYGGGRAAPFDWLQWASAGYAHFVMDTRGQGSAWSAGDTADPDATATAGQFPGFVTRGIESPASYYYRRLIADAALALDAARAHPSVDGDRIVVTGKSQGGGLALAVAGLSADVRAAAIDVPFLSHWRRALEVTDAHPYHELTRYLAVHRDRVDQAFRTLSYCDGLNFAARASAPALFSVGLRDEICPPSTVYAAYHAYGGPAELAEYPYNDHDGGGPEHELRQFAWLADRFGTTPG